MQKRCRKTEKFVGCDGWWARGWAQLCMNSDKTKLITKNWRQFCSQRWCRLCQLKSNIFIPLLRLQSVQREREREKEKKKTNEWLNELKVAVWSWRDVHSSTTCSACSYAFQIHLFINLFFSRIALPCWKWITKIASSQRARATAAQIINSSYLYCCWCCSLCCAVLVMMMKKKMGRWRRRYYYYLFLFQLFSLLCFKCIFNDLFMNWINYYCRASGSSSNNSQLIVLHRAYGPIHMCEFRCWKRYAERRNTFQFKSTDHSI